jgi:hypothetical protein
LPLIRGRSGRRSRNRQGCGRTLTDHLSGRLDTDRGRRGGRGGAQRRPTSTTVLVLHDVLTSIAVGSGGGEIARISAHVHNVAGAGRQAEGLRSIL